MANYSGGGYYSKNRMTDEEAYDRLPITLKRCLQEAVTSWCAYAVLKHFEKHGLTKTIDKVHQWDDTDMRKGVQMRRFHKKVPGSFVACRVKPLRIYGIKRTTRVGSEFRSGLPRA